MLYRLIPPNKYFDPNKLAPIRLPLSPILAAHEFDHRRLSHAINLTAEE
jgi:hypothetical protein